jgi:hypothetical protein
MSTESWSPAATSSGARPQELMEALLVSVTRDDPAYEDLRTLELPTWAPGANRHVLVLTPISVSGRRLGRIKRPGP